MCSVSFGYFEWKKCSRLERDMLATMSMSIGDFVSLVNLPESIIRWVFPRLGISVFSLDWGPLVLCMMDCSSG